MKFKADPTEKTLVDRLYEIVVVYDPDYAFECAVMGEPVKLMPRELAARAHAAEPILFKLAVALYAPTPLAMTIDTTAPKARIFGFEFDL